MINLRIKRQTLEGMIETYECLYYHNKKDKECKKVLTLLKKSSKEGSLK
jgi:hypothetical protein